MRLGEKIVSFLPAGKSNKNVGLLERMMALQSKISKAPTQPNLSNVRTCPLRSTVSCAARDADGSACRRYRQRFSKRLADGRTAIYVGEWIEISFQPGRLVAGPVARLIGGPLPISTDTQGPKHCDGDRR